MEKEVLTCNRKNVKDWDELTVIEPMITYQDSQFAILKNLATYWHKKGLFIDFLATGGHHLNAKHKWLWSLAVASLSWQSLSSVYFSKFNDLCKYSRHGNSNWLWIICGVIEFKRTVIAMGLTWTFHLVQSFHPCSNRIVPARI